MIDRGKHSVLGVRINAVDYDAAVSKIAEAAQGDQPLAVSALAVHGLMTGVLDSVHRFRLNKFDLLVPDGQPVRWALNWLYGTKLSDRVYGPELTLRVCQRAAEQGIPIFLFGGSETLLADLGDSLLKKFPDLKIAGTRASRFRKITNEERDELVADIRDSGAKITLVGLGCPRQEVFTYELRDRLSMPLLAVGAAFNFHAGQLSQAPPLLQRWGAEWLYRLAMEPRRLWRRYVLLNPLYVGLLCLQATGMYKINPEQAECPTVEVNYG